MIFGYLDAGSGSLILQALLGGIAGIAVAGKAWKQKFQAARAKRRGEPTEGPAKQEEPVASDT